MSRPGIHCVKTQSIVISWIVPAELWYLQAVSCLCICQTVPGELSCCAGRQLAVQGGGCAGCGERCLPALVQCVPVPHAEHWQATKGEGGNLIVGWLCYHRNSVSV